jgi:serine/threonine protein kinase
MSSCQKLKQPAVVLHKNTLVTFIKNIGKGAYGDVYKVLLQPIDSITPTKINIKNSNEGTEAALKSISSSTHGIRSLIELAIMKSISHQHITSCQTIDVDLRGNTYIISDLAEGALGPIIRKEKCLPNSQTLNRWSWQLVVAVAHLHSNGIVHGDIKGANVLVYRYKQSEATLHDTLIVKQSVISPVLKTSVKREVSSRQRCCQLLNLQSNLMSKMCKSEPSNLCIPIKKDVNQISNIKAVLNFESSGTTSSFTWDNSYVKLNDFSLCIPVMDPREGLSTETVYTSTHRPMEIWKGMQWSFSSDIWALGLTLYELAYGDYLFPSQKEVGESNTNILAQQNWASSTDTYENNFFRQTDNKDEVEHKSSTPVFTISSRLINNQGIIPNYKNHRLYQLSSKWNNPEMKIFNDLLLLILNIDSNERPNIYEIINHSYFDHIRNKDDLPPNNKYGYPILRRDLSLLDENLTKKYTQNTDIISLSSKYYRQLNEDFDIKYTCTIDNKVIACVLIATKIIHRNIPNNLIVLINNEILILERHICQYLKYKLLPTVNDDSESA